MDLNLNVKFLQTSTDPEVVVRAPEHLVDHCQVGDDVHSGDTQPENQDHHASLAIKIRHPSPQLKLRVECYFPVVVAI